jgi:hypothetical protein
VRRALSSNPSKREGRTARVLMLHPLFTDMAQFLCPEVARFMSPIELGHSDASFLFSHRLSMAYDSSKARLCGADNPSSFDTTTLFDSSDHLVLS